MKRRQALALTGVSAMTFLFPGSFVDADSGTGWRHGSRFGFGARHRRRNPARFCGENTVEHLDWLIRYAEKELAPTAEQMPAWRDLVGELRESAAELADTCSLAKTARPAATALRILEEGEEMLEAGLRRLNRIQPKLATLYATLSGEQKARLDAMIAQRHR